MDDDLLPRWLRRWGTGAWLVLGILIVIGLVGVAVSVTRTVTVPLILGAYFAVVLHPIVDALAGRNVPRGLGALAVIVGLFAALFAVGALIGATIADEWPDLRANIDTTVDDVREWVDDLPIDEDLVDRFDQGAGSSGGFALDGIGPRVASAASSVAGLIAGAFLGVIVLFYLLKDGRSISERLTTVAQDRGRDDVDELLAYAAGAMRRYYASRSALAALNGISISIGMAVIGVPGALAIGVVNFVGAYIPYFGAFVGGAFAVVLAVSEGGLGLALIALAIVIVAQVLLENLLEPRLVSGFVDLPPLAVLLVTTLGGVLLGLVGLILATPTTVIALQAVRTLRFGDPVPEVPSPDDQDDPDHEVAGAALDTSAGESSD
ncbi:MAG: AI-2E family transporter [Actinomycetota bacterium]